MNKQELIGHVASDTGLSKTDAKAAVESVFANIQKAVSEGKDAAFVGFGTFKVTSRSARTGRNPQTGAEIQIAASKSVSFKPSKAVKEAVN